MFDITTGTGDFIANGVVSHNCFARNTHTYLDLNAGRDFEREIVVKVNVPELLRAELGRPSWKRELIAFGTNTDPYQWAEGKYELMPPMIKALLEAETPTSILTKSPLVLRDLDVLLELAEVADVSVNFSVPTLDEKIWRETEPHTPHPRKRLEAVAKFNEAGIPSGVLVAPLMPGINDSPELVDEIVSIAEESGATFVNGIALHLRPGVKEVFMSWLSAARPDLVPRYDRLYEGRAYAPNAERKRIGGLVRTPNLSDDPRYSRRARLEARRKRRARGGGGARGRADQALLATNRTSGDGSPCSRSGNRCGEGQRKEVAMPPRGVKKGSKWERMYEQVKRSEQQEGRSEARAEEIAARTVNKERARAGETRQASRTSREDISSYRRGGLRSGHGPGGRTYDQLYEEAKHLGIEGRSKMNKRQLVGAVEGKKRRRR